jgi:hypothetical protein
MRPMDLIKHSAEFVLSAILLCQIGCTDLHALSSADFRRQVVVKSAENSPDKFWMASELQLRRYRLLFSGYDTVYYYLYAVKPQPDVEALHFRLHIDANYGGLIRHYDQAKIAGGVYPAFHQRHEVVRCQLFSNMVDSCLYRDQAEIELSKTELEAARIDGLNLALSAKNAQDYEHLDLPAAYIDGFLQALQTP